MTAVSPWGDEIEILKIGSDDRPGSSSSASYPLSFRYKLVSHSSSRIWFMGRYQGKEAGVSAGSEVYTGSGNGSAPVYGYGLAGEKVDSIQVSLGEVLNEDGRNGRIYLKLIFTLDQPLKPGIY